MLLLSTVSFLSLASTVTALIYSHMYRRCRWTATLSGPTGQCWRRGDIAGVELLHCLPWRRENCIRLQRSWEDRQDTSEKEGAIEAELLVAIEVEAWTNVAPPTHRRKRLLGVASSARLIFSSWRDGRCWMPLGRCWGDRFSPLNHHKLYYTCSGGGNGECPSSLSSNDVVPSLQVLYATMWSHRYRCCI